MSLNHRSLTPIAAVVALAAILLAPAAAPAQLSPPDSLTTTVSAALARHGLVGVTWALVTPDGISLGAAGQRDRERGTAMTPETRVQVGSVTKMLVATGVLRLVTERRVDLDAPILRYLPELPLDNPWEREHPVLVRHLLDHTSGLPDIHLWQVFTNSADPDAPLASGLVRAGQRLRVRHQPGDRFSYSNTGFLILGLLIERVTGTRYEAWLDDNLLAPLGMVGSTFRFVSQVGTNPDTSMAMGYFDGVTPNPSYAIPVRPAAQFATTAGDMARLATFLMGDGVVEGRAFIDSTLLRGMARPTTTLAARGGLATGYASGMLRRERWGITGNCHLGNIGTYRAVFCIYPESRRAFFASYNTDPEEANFDAIDSLFAARLGIPETPLAPTTIGDDVVMNVDPADWNGWYVARPHRFPQFAYVDEAANVTRVRWDGVRLHLEPLIGTSWASRVLEPVGGALFRLQSRRSPSHLVAVEGQGLHVVTDGMRTLERVSRLRIVLLLASAMLGVVALLYLLVAAPWRTLQAWRRASLAREPLRWSAFPLLALLVVPLGYLTQHPLAIGDATVPNIALAVVTAILPIALATSLAQRWRAGVSTGGAVWNLAALAAALQWCVVLAVWRLVPLVLWR